MLWANVTSRALCACELAALDDPGAEVVPAWLPGLLHEVNAKSAATAAAAPVSDFPLLTLMSFRWYHDLYLV